MRILIIRFSALGDIVLTYPFLEFLLSKDYEIDFITNKYSKEIIGLDGIDYISFDRKWNILKKIIFIFRLKKRKYDAVIDLQNNKWSRLITYFFNADKSKSIKDKINNHAIENYFEVFRKIFPDFLLKKEYKMRISEKVDKIEGKYVCIFFSSSKRWISKRPSERVIRDFISIIKDCGYKIAMIGDFNDKISIKEDIIDLCGTLSIEELKFVLLRCEFLVTTDSFPMHLGAFCGCRVLALFGPTDPERCGPWTTKKKVLCNSIDCQPCYKSKCIDNKCMDFSKKEIETAIDKIIYNK